MRFLSTLVQHNDKTPEVNNNSGKVNSSLPGTKGCNHLPPPHACHHVPNVIGFAKLVGRKFFITANYTLNTYSSMIEKLPLCGGSRQVSRNLLAVSEMDQSHMFSIRLNSLPLVPSVSLSFTVCMFVFVTVSPHFHGKLETCGLLQCYNRNAPQFCTLFSLIFKITPCSHGYVIFSSDY